MNASNAHLRKVIRSQYLASLAMLGQTIERCPDEMWAAPARTGPFWHVAYHALFYAHLYLAPDLRQFERWSKWRRDYQFLGRRPEPPFDEIAADLPYSREELREYLALCRSEVERRTGDVAFEAPSGFEWLPLDKLELQLYSIRHVQDHAGQLAERLGQAGIETEWVGAGAA